MGTWAAFIRVSDMGSRKAGADNVHTDRDQTQAVEQAVPRGDRVEWLPPELDVSGGLPLERRPSLLTAIEGVEAGRYCGLIVAYQSRLSRDPHVEEEVWKRVERAGGTILFALDPVDNTTVDGRMLRRIKGAMNAAERDRHVDQFERLREWAVGEGIWQARVAPLGYSKDPATRKLVPNDDAQMVVRAFRARARGASTSELCVMLGRSPTAVRHMLSNRVYLGEVRQARHVNPDAHPAIVDADLWLSVQYAEPRRPVRGDKAPGLLVGLVRCAGCGKAMSRSGAASRPTYACPRVSANGLCPAPASVTASLLDRYVDEVARAELAGLHGPEMRRDEGAVAAARAALSAAESELRAFLAGVQAAGLSPDVFAESARARQAEVDRASADLAQELAAQPSAAVDDILAAWDSFNASEKNHALRSLIEVVLVHRAGGRGGGRGPQVALASRVEIVKRGGDALRGIRADTD